MLEINEGYNLDMRHQDSARGSPRGIISIVGVPFSFLIVSQRLLRQEIKQAQGMHNGNRLVSFPEESQC
jgi:hypothetical protein